MFSGLLQNAVAIRTGPVHRLVFAIHTESSEYAQYSYLFMAAPVRSAGICYSYGTLFTDLLSSVFSSYVFYRLNLILLFVSFVAHVMNSKYGSRTPKCICYSYRIKFLLEMYMKFLSLLKFLVIKFP